MKKKNGVWYIEDSSGWSTLRSSEVKNTPSYNDIRVKDRNT